MTETFLSALNISLTSISIIVIMFIGLWLLLWMLIALPINKEPVIVEKSESQVEKSNSELVQKAAAIAVILALAEMKSNSMITQPAKMPVLVSAWQLGMRTRQMLQKSNNRRRI